jgi:hypothetical protein
MGTKNNPGKFDCYANAAPDEPMFILLGRDPAASLLVKLWVEMRRRTGESEEKLAEATALADEMLRFAMARGKRTNIIEATRALQVIAGITKPIEEIEEVTQT